MKKNYYAIINFVLLIILIFAVYSVFKPQKLGEVYQGKFDVFEKNLKLIEENMSEITTNNKWDQLKDVPKAEKIQKTAYDMLVADIKTCYLQEKNLNDESVDNLKILSFKNKRKITSKELEVFTKNNCLNNFKKYSTVEFSKEKDLNEKLQKQIALIITTEDNNTNYKEFKDTLNKELNIIHSVANLSSWLKIEYNTYK